MNPFRKLLPDEVKQREHDAKLIADKVKLLAEIGGKLLSCPEGLRYKELLEVERDNIIKMGMRNTEPDPIKYAFACKAIFSSLGVLYGMLDEIKKDVNARR